MTARAENYVGVGWEREPFSIQELLVASSHNRDISMFYLLMMSMTGKWRLSAVSVVIFDILPTPNIWLVEDK